MIPVIVHLVGEDAIRGELDAPPDPTHQFLFLRNVMKKDMKPLAYLTEGAEVILYAWSRITFVEVMRDITLSQSSASPTTKVLATNGKVAPAGTTVLGFFRDDEE
jgi:hypothetical protein